MLRVLVIQPRFIIKSFLGDALHYLSDSIDYKIIPSELFKPNINLRHVVRFINELNPEVIFSDPGSLYLPTVINHLKRKNIRMITYLRGDLWTEERWKQTNSCLGYIRSLLNARLSFMGLSFSNCIVAVSRWLESIVKCRCPRIRTRVLYPCVSTKIFEDKPIELNHPAVGILQSYDILPKASEVSRILYLSRSFKSVNFYVAGSGSFLNYIKSKVSGARNVFFLGRLNWPNSVRRFLSSIDIYVHPSGLDAAPVSILEASALGKPVLASGLGGIPELVIDGKTGLLVYDPKEWMDKLSLLLEDKILSTRLGYEGKALIQSNFTPLVMASRLINLLNIFPGE